MAVLRLVDDGFFGQGIRRSGFCHKSLFFDPEFFDPLLSFAFFKSFYYFLKILFKATKKLQTKKHFYRKKKGFPKKESPMPLFVPKNVFENRKSLIYFFVGDIEGRNYSESVCAGR